VSRSISIRNISFDLSTETPRYWYEGSPGRTHLMNALSTTFPAGEAFFVRSVQHYRDAIDDPELLDQMRRFGGQEGVHAREHDRHVELLVQQGYGWIPELNRIADREMRFYNRRLPKFALATTAALEHITAILAHRALANPEMWNAAMHPDMAPMWQWHAMEEAEHKGVAFDVLARVSGNHALRIVAMIGATLGLLLDNLIRFTYFTAKDGNLWKPSVWLDAARFAWGRDGFYRALIPTYLRWYRRDFHPWHEDDQPLIDAQLERMAAAS
jgi:predicted metal-dependent hydrolase